MSNRFPPPPTATITHQSVSPSQVQTPAVIPVGNEKQLTEDETAFILRTTLLAEHREDPNILRFISNYMRCRNANQAAREAGLTPQSGQSLRTRPDIHAAISALTTKQAMKYGFDASEVIERVKEVSNLDPLDFCNPDGSYRKLHEIPPEARRAIKKIKARNLFDKDPNGMTTVIGEIIEIELWDKMKAHELLGREKDLFKEKKEVVHDISHNMAAALLESAKRGEDRYKDAIDVTPVKEITGANE